MSTQFPSPYTPLRRQLIDDVDSDIYVSWWWDEVDCPTTRFRRSRFRGSLGECPQRRDDLTWLLVRTSSSPFQFTLSPLTAVGRERKLEFSSCLALLPIPDPHDYDAIRKTAQMAISIARLQEMSAS